MKILLTGGGTGGHFYPLMAVADSLAEIADRDKIIKMEISLMSDDPYDKDLLLQKGIDFRQASAGKIRRYFSLLNVVDFFKMGIGVAKAILDIYFDFPDVIFSKGGYAAFPAVFAARIFGIPLVIHESDAVPGKVNLWSGKFAKRIAISFPGAAKYFSKEKTALVGNPIRKELSIRATTGVKEFFKLEDGIQTILLIGGSQGAVSVSDAFLDVVPELVQKYQIIHQCGENNFKDTQARVSVILDKSPYQSRYHLFPYLDISDIRMAYGTADLVVSRAGGGLIFEIASAGLPSILIPLNGSAQDHQKANAYSYASTGAADVIEQQNLLPHLLQSEIERLLGDKNKLKEMSESAKKFATPDAADKIAREIVNLALAHA